jgi:hypothetical protein
MHTAHDQLLQQTSHHLSVGRHHHGEQLLEGGLCVEVEVEILSTAQDTTAIMTLLKRK